MISAFTNNRQRQGLNLNLYRLQLIRCLVILGQVAALYFAISVWPERLEIGAILSIIVFEASVLFITVIRLQWQWQVTHLEFFIQLLIDLIGLTALLYVSGGANNPFVSYYLVPLCISAAVLPWRFTWLFATAAMAAYSFLLFYYIPIDTLSPELSHSQNHGMHHHAMGHNTVDNNLDGLSLVERLNFHIIGMWINFIVSTALITYFVVKMAQALKEQDTRLNQQIEQRLRDEQILSIATQAAGTAHELGTPLSTLTILLEEMKHRSLDTDFNDDITVMEQQVNICRAILQRLSSTAQQHSLNDLTAISCNDFFTQVKTHWQVLSPAAKFNHIVQSEGPGPLIQNNPAIEQALINLLNNALRESKEAITITTHWTESHFYIEIQDDGQGFPDFVLSRKGQAIAENNSEGLGLGLMLTTASIEQSGGRLSLSNTKDGANASVVLPAIENKLNS